MFEKLLRLTKHAMRALGLRDVLLKAMIRLNIRDWFLKYHLTPAQKLPLLLTPDPVRYMSLYLAIKTILRENIPGDFAEAGVYQGDTSKIIHSLAPDRKLFLFDTFEGFHEMDLKHGTDGRFQDTSVEYVSSNIGDVTNVEFRVGWFPETAKELEARRFAFVMLDMDMFDPTLAGLEFFYPRLTPGGFLLLHDYNSPESDHAVSRAVSAFMKDKPEGVIEIPDMCGSVIIRRNRSVQ